MTFKDFIEKFVLRNTVIRLWTKNRICHKMIHDGDKEVSMEWETLDGKPFQSKYLSNNVIGVTDIVCDSYPESVNIVIEL